MASETDGWESWSRYVRGEIERQGKALDELNAKLDDIRVEIATLKVHTSVWSGVIGGLCGLIPVLVALALKLIGS